MPHAIYKDATSWLDHMQIDHKVTKWKCDLEPHQEILVFDKESDFVTHIDAIHGETFTSDESLDLAILKKHEASRDLHTDIWSNCPICMRSFAEQDFMSIYCHIAEDLVDYANFSLPDSPYSAMNHSQHTSSCDTPVTNLITRKHGSRTEADKRLPWELWETSSTETDKDLERYKEGCMDVPDTNTNDTDIWLAIQEDIQTVLHNRMKNELDHIKHQFKENQDRLNERKGDAADADIVMGGLDVESNQTANTNFPSITLATPLPIERADVEMESPPGSVLHGRSATFAMSKRERLQGDDNTDQSSNTTKRHKAVDNYIHSDPIKFRHEDYTVAWICALPVEMAAARAMLDNIHEGLIGAPEDSNAYILGNIGPHNIVIACLPSSYYGTNNAATVSSDMKRSFPSIDIRLMVGIGGGAPGKLDLRLGDIVVGSRVMQSDLGKITGDGQIERTIIQRIPPSKLLTNISKLRAIHESTPSRVSSILKDMHQRNPTMTKYAHPSSQDLLFRADYHHNLSDAFSCDECDASKLIHRLPRTSPDPKIHYGAIASSNQVMRHGLTRDKIARDLDVVCFEMEAAGLADFPCLVIRGICDYSDSHKNKQWQEYAAAAAAAYAKEFLEAIPMPQSQVGVQEANILIGTLFSMSPFKDYLKHRSQSIYR